MILASPRVQAAFSTSFSKGIPPQTQSSRRTQKPSLPLSLSSQPIPKSNVHPEIVYCYTNMHIYSPLIFSSHSNNSIFACYLVIYLGNPSISVKNFLKIDSVVLYGYILIYLAKKLLVFKKALNLFPTKKKAQLKALKDHLLLSFCKTCILSSS